MTLFGRNRIPLWFSLAAVLSASTTPGLLIADDKAEADSPTKAALIKSDAPTPGLTERERWLLDRVEQLEKRVAELESKSIPTAAPPVNASAALPASANAAAPAVAALNSTIAPGPTPANSDTLSNDRVAAVGTQATEKGKSGAAKPGKADPFAFADFTWLNGNSRTKDTPYATSFFTPEIRADVDYNYSFITRRTTRLVDRVRSSGSAKSR